MPAAASSSRLLFVLLLAVAAAAWGADPVDRVLTAGTALKSEHTTPEGVRYRIPVETGRVAEFSLRQQRGATEVRVDNGAGRSFALQIEAGRQAQLQIPLVGSGQPWLISVLPRRAGGA